MNIHELFCINAGCVLLWCWWAESLSAIHSALYIITDQLCAVCWYILSLWFKFLQRQAFSISLLKNSFFLSDVSAVDTYVAVIEKLLVISSVVCQLCHCECVVIFGLWVCHGVESECVTVSVSWCWVCECVTECVVVFSLWVCHCECVAVLSLSVSLWVCRGVESVSVSLWVCHAVESVSVSLWVCHGVESECVMVFSKNLHLSEERMMYLKELSKKEAIYERLASALGTSLHSCLCVCCGDHSSSVITDSCFMWAQEHYRPQPTRRTSWKLVWQPGSTGNPGFQLVATSSQLFWVANRLATCCSSGM